MAIFRLLGLSLWCVSHQVALSFHIHNFNDNRIIHRRIGCDTRLYDLQLELQDPYLAYPSAPPPQQQQQQQSSSLVAPPPPPSPQVEVSAPLAATPGDDGPYSYLSKATPLPPPPPPFGGPTPYSPIITGGPNVHFDGREVRMCDAPSFMPIGD